jgi:fatty acid desaturase
MMKHQHDIRSVFALFLISFIRIFMWQTEPNLAWYGWLMLSWSCVILSIIKHNQIHLSVFSNKKANLVYESVLIFFTGSTCGSMILIHIINHHKETNGTADWGKTTTFRHRSELWNILKYVLMTLPAFIKNKREWLKNKSNDTLKKKINAESRLLLGFYVVFFFIKPMATFYYLLLPNIAGQFLLISLNYCQHNGCDETSKLNHSRNFTNHLLNFMLFNAGFHTAHHIFPNKHWSEYPKIHHTLLPKIDKKNNEFSLFFYIFKLLFKVKRPNTEGSQKANFKF